jgi:IclR family acetate operon transcriptional repressor
MEIEPQLDTLLLDDQAVTAETSRCYLKEASTAGACWPQIPRSVVKSAGRVLQILEFFDDVKRDASVIEICQSLGYPQSSTSVLLRSLVELGYLSYDARRRAYHPTNRVRVLGNWINGSLFGEGKLPRLVNELNARTGHVIFLGARNGLHIQYIHVAQATTSLRLHLIPGTSRPIASSVGGQVLLSILPDLEVQKLVRRINAERLETDPLVDSKELLSTLRMIRTNGANTCHASKITPGAAVIALLLPSVLADPPLVLGVGGASQLMVPQLDEIVACMHEVIAHCMETTI